jgi:hypothetical protein
MLLSKKRLFKSDTGSPLKDFIVQLIGLLIRNGDIHDPECIIGQDDHRTIICEKPNDVEISIPYAKYKYKYLVSIFYAKKTVFPKDPFEKILLGNPVFFYVKYLLLFYDVI